MPNSPAVMRGCSVVPLAVAATLYAATLSAIRRRYREGSAVLCGALTPQCGDISGAPLAVPSEALLHVIQPALVHAHAVRHGDSLPRVLYRFTSAAWQTKQHRSTQQDTYYVLKMDEHV